MSTLQQLPIEQLRRGRYQPRQHFDEQALQELAQSIATHGLIEPIVVRASNDTGEFEIIAGERRWRAAMLLGLSTLPCLIGDYSDQQVAAMTIVENVQRADLNLVEEALAYQRLTTEFRFTQEEIATLVGKSRSHIANILRLLTLTESIQQMLRLGTLSMGHAKCLVGLNTEQQQELAELTQRNSWSVRQLERALRNHLAQSTNPEQHSHDIGYLETKIAEQLGSPVQIISDTVDQGGFLKIKFFNNDTLEGLLQRMGLLDAINHPTTND